MPGPRAVWLLPAASRRGAELRPLRGGVCHTPSEAGQGPRHWQSLGGSWGGRPQGPWPPAPLAWPMPALAHPSVSQTLCNLQAGGDALNIETSWAGRPLPHQAFIFNPWLCLVVSSALERAGSPRGSLHSPDGGPNPPGTPLPGPLETCLAPTTDCLGPPLLPSLLGGPMLEVLSGSHPGEEMAS